MTYFQIDFLCTHILSWLQCPSHMLSAVFQSAFTATELPHTKHLIICLTPGVCLAGCKSTKETHGPLSQKSYQQNNQIASGDPSIDLWEEGRRRKCLEQFCEQLYLHDHSKMIRRKWSKIRQQLLIFYSAWPYLTAILPWSANNPL